VKESTNVPIVKRVSNNCHNFDNIQDYILVCFFFIYIFFYYSKISLHQSKNSSTLQQFQLVFFIKSVGDWKPNMNNEFLYLLPFKSCSLKKEKQSVLEFFSDCNSLKKSNHIWLIVTKWCYYKHQTFILAFFCNFSWIRVDLYQKSKPIWNS
jgi:hypothetical protein